MGVLYSVSVMIPTPRSEIIGDVALKCELLLQGLIAINSLKSYGGAYMRQ